VQFHPKRNALFINMMLNERLKYLYNRGLKSDMYYYETTHGLGVPVLYEHQDHLHTAMITSSPIAKETDANKLLRFLELSGIAPEHCAILYNGKKTVEINSIEFRPWRSHIVTRIERNSFAI
jgi:hypothetical protein